MPADIQDKWRDEDGPPSPQQELTEWWLDEPRRPVVDLTYPPDHEEYLHELYAEIAMLRKHVAEIEAVLQAARLGKTA